MMRRRPLWYKDTKPKKKKKPPSNKRNQGAPVFHHTNEIDTGRFEAAPDQNSHPRMPNYGLSSSEKQSEDSMIGSLLAENATRNRRTIYAVDKALVSKDYPARINRGRDNEDKLAAIVDKYKTTSKAQKLFVGGRNRAKRITARQNSNKTIGSTVLRFQYNNNEIRNAKFHSKQESRMMMFSDVGNAKGRGEPKNVSGPTGNTSTTSVIHVQNFVYNNNSYCADPEVVIANNDQKSFITKTTQVNLAGVELSKYVANFI